MSKWDAVIVDIRDGKEYEEVLKTFECDSKYQSDAYKLGCKLCQDWLNYNMDKWFEFHVYEHH